MKPLLKKSINLNSLFKNVLKIIINKIYIIIAKTITVKDMIRYNVKIQCVNCVAQ
jgi:hypothetical protein